MGKSLYLNFGNHFNHIRYHLFTFSDVELQGFVVLLTLFVVFGSTTPLRFTLVVLSDSQMLISILLVSLEDDFGILVHHLMRLSDDKGLLSLSSEDKELDGFLLESSGLAILSNHQGALRKLRLGPEDVLSLLWVVKEF